MLRLLMRFLVGKVFFSIFSLSLTLILINTLSAEEFGKYSIFMTSISLISVCFYGWARLAFTRKYFSIKRSITLHSSISINSKATVLLLVTFAILFILYAFDVINEIYCMAILIAMFIGLNDFFNEINRVEKRANLYSIFSATRVTFTLLIMLFLFFFEVSLNLSIIVPIIVIAAILSLFITVYFFYKNINKSKASKKNIERVFFRYGFPLSLSLIVSFIIFNTDKYLTTYYWGVSELGLYSSVQMLLQFGVNMLVSSFSLVWNPYVFNLVKKGGESEAIKAHKSNFIYYVYIYIFISFIIFVLGEEVFSAVNVNNSYSNYTNLLIIFTSFFFLYFKIYYVDCFYQIKGRTRSIFFNNIFIMFLNLLLGLYFIPAFGPVGGALSTLVGVFIFIFYFYFRCFFTSEVRSK